MMGIFKRFWAAITGADRPETLYDFPSYQVDPVTDKVVNEDMVLATMGSEIAKTAEPVAAKADVEQEALQEPAKKAKKTSDGNLLSVSNGLKLSKGQKVYVKGYGMQHTVFSMTPSGNVNLRYRSRNYWYNRSGVPLSKILLEKPVKK